MISSYLSVPFILEDQAHVICKHQHPETLQRRELVEAIAETIACRRFHYLEEAPIFVSSCQSYNDLQPGTERVALRQKLHRVWFGCTVLHFALARGQHSLGHLDDLVSRTTLKWYTEIALNRFTVTKWYIGIPLSLRHFGAEGFNLNKKSG